MGRKAEDLTGRVFGKLVVLEPTTKQGGAGKSYRWLCR